jgi:hypothetical protein
MKGFKGIVLLFLSVLFCLGYLVGRVDTIISYVIRGFGNLRAMFMWVKMKLKLSNKEGSKDLKKGVHV